MLYSYGYDRDIIIMNSDSHTKAGAVIIVGIVLIIIVSWVILTYNRFVRLRNMVEEAWSGIDVQLKRRADLIPNLVAVVGGYAQHERATLEEVVKRRTAPHGAASAGEVSRTENALTQSLTSLFAVAEAYPDLKANEEFTALQRTLVEIEDQIQFSRRYYNGATRNYNILRMSFPNSMLASLFHLQSYEYFEVETSAERISPNAAF